MFNVTRPLPGPDCSKDYRSKEVIHVLREMFHGKCYLCEDEVNDPEVEHFIPHKGDDTKKYCWNNLFYACARCNSIKGDIDDELLDCTDSSIKVSDAVKCLCPSVPDSKVFVESQWETSAAKNTAKLLDRCYNEDNTGIRDISQEMLREKIFEYYTDLINHRRILKNRNSSKQCKDDATEHLHKMQEDFYPFSIFWKWHVRTDTILQKLLSAEGSPH